MRNEIELTELHDLMLAIEVEVDVGDETENAWGTGAYLTTDYSGRGMYGERCVGIVCDDVASTLFTLGMEIGDRISNETGTTWLELAETFKQSRQDSMGLSSIVYFPGLTVDTTDAYETSDR